MAPIPNWGAPMRGTGPGLPEGPRPHPNMVRSKPRRFLRLRAPLSIYTHQLLALRVGTEIAVSVLGSAGTMLLERRMSKNRCSPSARACLARVGAVSPLHLSGGAAVPVAGSNEHVWEVVLRTLTADRR